MNDQNLTPTEQPEPAPVQEQPAPLVPTPAAAMAEKPKGNGKKSKKPNGEIAKYSRNGMIFAVIWALFIIGGSFPQLSKGASFGIWQYTVTGLIHALSGLLPIAAIFFFQRKSLKTARTLMLIGGSISFLNGTLFITGDTSYYFLILPVVFTLVLGFLTMPTKQAPRQLLVAGGIVAGMIALMLINLPFRLDSRTAQTGDAIGPTLLWVMVGVLSVLLLFLLPEGLRFFMNHALRTKLLVAIIGLTLVSSATLFAFNLISTQNALTEAETNAMVTLAEQRADDFSEMLNARLSSMLSMATLLVHDEDLVAQNASYSGSQESILAEILLLDEQWPNASDSDPLINNVLTNELAEELNHFMEVFDYMFVEVFITDGYGANVAAFERTSDYYQADEGWWQAAYNNGKGAIYFGEVEYDESSATFGFNMAVPIYDERTSDVIGIIRTTATLDQFILELQEGLAEGDVAQIVLPSGLAVHEVGSAPTQYPIMHLNALNAASVEEVIQMDIEGEEFFMSQSYVTSDVNPAIDQVGWRIVFHESVSRVLAPVQQQTISMALIALVVAAVSSAVAAYLAQTISNPVISLTGLARAFADGDYSVRTEVTSTDEIGELATSFNVMANTVDMQTQDLVERSREMEASQRVTFAASERTTPEDFLNMLVNLLADQFDVYHCQVYMVDEGRKNAVLEQSTGYAGRQLLQRKHSIPLDRESLVTRCINTGESVLVGNTTADPNWLPNPVLPLTQSELVVPLKIDDVVIGALDIQDRVVDRFTEQTVPVFESMTEHVAFLFQSTELLEQVTAQTQNLERFADQLRSASDVANQLGAILDPETLLDQAVILLQSQFNLYHAHIYLLDETEENLVVQAGSGHVGILLKQAQHSIPVDAPTSFVARAAREQSPVLVPDVSTEPDFMPNPMLPDTHSELSVPLITGGRVLGVLDLQDEVAGRFTETDADTLGTLAGQIATAIQNAELFQSQQEAETQFRVLVENAPEAIVVLDCDTPNARFMEANDNASILYGLPKEELLKVGPGEMSPEYQPDGRLSSVAAKEYIGQALEGGAPTFDWIHINGAGEEIQCEVRLVSLPAEGRNLVRGSVTDIAERKQYEEGIVQSDRLKSEFLANMSHELRTPLNSIIGYTDVLLMGIDGEIDEEIATDIQAIHDNGQNLLRIINDILDLAKIEAGRMEMEFVEFEVLSLLEEVKSNQDGLLLDKPVELVVEVLEALPPLQADRMRIGQILTNLISNAVKFTEEGRITLRAFMEESMIHLEVQDTGAGIPDEALEDIFDEFTQADSSATRTVEGTGLGLTITRRLAQLHKGDINVQSQVGVGSIFTVRLPIVQRGLIRKYKDKSQTAIMSTGRPTAKKTKLTPAAPKAASPAPAKKKAVKRTPVAESPSDLSALTKGSLPIDIPPSAPSADGSDGADNGDIPE